MINTRFDFELLGKSVAVIIERIGFVTQILIMGDNDDFGIANELSAFSDQMKLMLKACDVEEDACEGIIKHIEQFLDKLALRSVKLSLEKVYIHITKEDTKPAVLDYALRITMSFKREEPQTGLLSFFKLEKLTLNLWNIPAESPVYKSFEIETIDSILNNVNILNNGSGSSLFLPATYDAAGLTSYVRRVNAMNTVYMWGCFGSPVTAALIEQKKKQYPNEYTPSVVDNLTRLIGKGYYGIDCSGLIKSYYWGGIGNISYDKNTDHSANTLHNLAKSKGPIASLPEKPGLCVWMDGHIGVYIGNGYVIESTPNERFGNGVVQTKLTDRKWVDWLECPYISY